MSVAKSLLARFLEKPLATRAIIGGLAGATGGAVENKTILSDYDPNTRHINTMLGAATGALVGGGAGDKNLVAKAVAGWTAKQLALTAVGTSKKYVDMQIPIAEKNLETARLNQSTAALTSEQAKQMTPQALAQMGMAGAGLAGAGGLAYYLYKTLGAGKKKPSPKVTIDLPKIKGQRGDVHIEGDEDTLDLSRNLYQKLKRDQRRALLSEARVGTQHERKIIPMVPETEKAACLGIITVNEVTTSQRLQNIACLLQ